MSFGPDCSKPLSVQTEQVKAFLNQTGPDGSTNLEKIRRNQRVIRRVSTTDKTKSYEDADTAAGSHDGVVVRDGKLIGFGIHIFNEDIYPLQSFEIYLRNCGLTGDLVFPAAGICFSWTSTTIKSRPLTFAERHPCRSSASKTI